MIFSSFFLHSFPQGYHNSETLQLSKAILHEHMVRKSKEGIFNHLQVRQFFNDTDEQLSLNSPTIIR